MKPSGKFQFTEAALQKQSCLHKPYCWVKASHSIGGKGSLTLFIINISRIVTVVPEPKTRNKGYLPVPV